MTDLLIMKTNWHNDEIIAFLKYLHEQIIKKKQRNKLKNIEIILRNCKLGKK